MKKVFLAIAAVLFTANVSAYNARMNDDKFDMKVNSARLCNYLGVNGVYANQVEEVSALFTNELEKAANSPESVRANRVKDAVYGNLKLMRKYLTKDQYHKYVTVMNATLKNKGLDVYFAD